MARNCDKRDSWNFFNLIRKLDVLCLDVRIENDNFQQKIVYKFIKSTTRLNICNWSKHFVQQLADSENQRKHQNYVLLFLCERDPLLTGGFPHKQQVIQKAFPHHDCLMQYCWWVFCFVFISAHCPWWHLWMQTYSEILCFDFDHKPWTKVLVNHNKPNENARLWESIFSTYVFNMWFFAQLSHCCNTKIWHT